MKTTGSLIGGRLIDDPRIYRSYALYLPDARRAPGARHGDAGVVNDFAAHRYLPSIVRRRLPGWS